MPELSLNLEIKGIGSTTMSMEDAKKLYNELRVLFEEKVKYVPNGGWLWNYPWWGYSYTNAYSNQRAFTKGIGNTSSGPTTGNVPSSYSVSI